MVSKISEGYQNHRLKPRFWKNSERINELKSEPVKKLSSAIVAVEIHEKLASVVYKKAFDTKRAGRTLVQHQPLNIITKIQIIGCIIIQKPINKRIKIHNITQIKE